MGPFASVAYALPNGWNRSFWGPVTWADAIMALGILVIAMLLNALLVWLLRRGALSLRGNLRGTVQLQLFHALGKPAYALTWAVALYLASIPIVAALDPVSGPRAVHRIGAALLDIVIFAVVLWLAVRFSRVLDVRMKRWTARTSSRADDLLVPLVGGSLRILLPVLAVIFALPLLHLPAAYAGVLARGTSILLIVAVALVLLQAVHTLQGVVLSRFDVSAADNLRARKVSTQVHVIGRVIDIVIGLFAVATVLMLFPQVRHIGASLLASAGVVGIIVGFAAQKTLANLLAGFQIALAQPMREDDVVIVEGEWGRVEEITLTYVVVHIWDDRRLVLPLSYFIEKPFQNWTRTSAQLLGSVFVWVDYSFPVEAGRQALAAILEASSRWDRRFWNLQVTDATDRAMQLRVLATAADASSAWDLRCEIREKFISYIRTHHPASLPLARAQLHPNANETAHRPIAPSRTDLPSLA